MKRFLGGAQMCRTTTHKLPGSVTSKTANQQENRAALAAFLTRRACLGRLTTRTDATGCPKNKPGQFEQDQGNFILDMNKTIKKVVP
jgi:hypothetical protein